MQAEWYNQSGVTCQRHIPSAGGYW